MNKIAIHSVPRSGSTWLGNIFNSHPKVNFNYQPLFSYAFKSALNEHSSKIEIDTFFRKLSENDDTFIKQSDGIRKGIIPDFKKSDVYTHICYKEVRYHNILKNVLEKDKEIKVIGLVRNPFSTINSWLNAPREFRGDLGWKVEEEWRFAPQKNLNKPEEYNGYEKWKEATYVFVELSKKYQNQFYLLNYDDLLNDVNLTINRVFSFCELDVPIQTYNFINPKTTINQQDAYSVFKSKKEDNEWVEKLSQSIIEEIKKDNDFQKLNECFKWI